MPKTKKPKLDISQQFEQTIDLLENTDQNIFITGKAGTGKSTLLQYFRDHTTKNIAVLAPTGVAALNVQGQTIHSFFLIAPGAKPEDMKYEKRSRRLLKTLKKIDTIIIDEISMVRADLLDCIDESLRHYLLSSKSFGGKQMVFIGDLYQLPPVVIGEEKNIFKTQYQSPYFFDANVMSGVDFEIVELDKIYRQTDKKFINLLNSIRNNTLDFKDLGLLNSRYIEDVFDPDDFFITLTTTNAAADEINRFKLAQLETDSNLFTGKIEGNFNSRQLPTAMDLELKVGAQVMCLNNDTHHRWVNGSMGRIIDIANNQFDDDVVLIVQLDNGEIVEVAKHKWEVNHYYYNDKEKTIDSETIGSFTQYPVRLAWAVTIHKSQGKTFDKVIVDIGYGAFAHGQVYVAISRCTSLEGLVLRKPIQRRHIWMDQCVIDFMEGNK